MCQMFFGLVWYSWVVQNGFIVVNLVLQVGMKENCHANNQSYVQVEYCQNIIRNIWFYGILLVGGVINAIIWLVFGITYYYIYYKNRWFTILIEVESRNLTLQTNLTQKTSEIANLQRQLNEINHRRAEVEEPLPPHTEQEHEREPLLLLRGSPDCQEPLYCSLPLHD